ncbi:TonB-dependent receptor domain-containing protein [Sphingorhabdus sp. M41]|uniref:TonB-dependent receptor domain-containing protein n=1 Tax=Sphingorhabdus sp. M41 TaxID=1806885 RepID=UPI00078DB9CF|nr:TonB-dependent receptor [Sphingorhabdus sp. M41]AMO73424.1 TonB-dependent receptor [Sphingorhabdus sp. M41]
MTKRTAMMASLLLSTALVAPAAYAQTTAADDPAVETIQPDDAQDDDDNVDISAPGGDFGGEIIVRGKYIPNPIRATSEVVSVLGEAEIARAADGDIAGSLQRVTGLSVVGGRFVFVRGLGERYSLALLNGLPLPSPEPLRRVVPLDLFPTSVIASTVVQKSYSANYPGEFGGGVINLTTKSTPDEPFLKVKFGVSGDSETTGKLGYVYDGSDSDIIGYDDGLRAIPNGLAQALAKNIPISAGTEFSSTDLQNFAASLNNAETNLIQRNMDIPANFSAEITGGTSFDVGDALVGVVATAGFDNSWRTRGGVQQTSQGIVNIDGEEGLRPDQNFNFVTTENRIIVNGLLGLSAEFGEHKLRFTNLYIHDTSKEASIKAGIDAINVDEETLLNQGRTSWFERQLFTTQFVGEFKFDEISLDVRGAWANSKRDAPYQRTYSYAFDKIVAQDFVNDLTSPGQSARVQFSDLNDDVYGAGADLGYETNIGVPVNLTVGYNYYLNDRQAQRRAFRFVPANGLPNPIEQERIDFLLSDYNVFTHKIELREVAAQTSVPAYEAQLEVHAGYGQFDAELSEGLRLNVGVRYEDAMQSVTPILLQGGAATVATSLANDYWLPAATLTWNFADDMQFRFAASKTIARPQFRELAPQQFLDLETDRTFIGNPLLTDSELLNFEGRFEYYIGRGERVTIAGFYKKIDNPIENVAFVQGGGTLFTGFSNAPTAELYGAELELVKYFPLYDLGGSFFDDRRLLLAANYTYTKSEIKVAAGDQAINPVTLLPTDASNVFDDGDRLTGQSTHVANLQFGMEREDGPLSQQTLLVTYNSPRVTARGPQDQPDLIERTGWQLDFVVREELNIAGQDFELKVEARNILGTDYRESQTLGSTQILNNAYDVGTRFSMSIGLNF